LKGTQEQVKEVDLMVFDLDGTLIQSGDDLAAAVNYTLLSLGISQIDPSVVKGFIGDGLQMLVRRALGEKADEYYERAIAIFYSYYSEHLFDRTTLYPEVPSLLNHFEDKLKIILTNKRQQYALTITQHFGIDLQFRDIIGEGSTPYKKPDPRLLDYVMTKWGATPRKTVVIGDGMNDILLARGAGAVSCAFLGGLTERNVLISLAPDLTCETLSDLKQLLS
jgi:phosphoglycolate phosphatase